MRLPKCRENRQRGTAFVEYKGRRHTLGPWGSPAAHRAYQRFLNEHIFPQKIVRPETPVGCRSIGGLLNSWRIELESRDRDQRQRELYHLRVIAQTIGPWAATRVDDFGPLMLQEFRRQLISRGNSRTQVNAQIRRLCRVFRWGVANEHVRESVYRGLVCVPALREGEDGVRESRPKRRVKSAAVDAVLPFLTPTKAAMVKIQRLTGMRSANLCSMTAKRIDRSKAVWVYRPRRHKSKWRGQKLAIPLGPQAQSILQPFMDACGENEYLFSPRRSRDEQNAIKRAARKSKVPPSQASRAAADPLKSPGKKFTSHSYGRAVQYACDRAHPMPDGLTAGEQKDWRKRHRWTPIQLRKLCASKVRRIAGLEGAQVTLGHARANVTELYAERNLSLAIRIAAEIG